MHQNKCLNCDSPLTEGDKYCPNCGQKKDTHRLSWHDITHDMVHYFTHADKSIFNLVKELAFQPGVVALEYVEGKRQKYFRPLNFFLIVAGIVVFMTGSFYKHDDSRSRSMEAAASRIQHPAAKQHLLEMAERVRKVNKVTGKYSNVISMVATPLMTLFFWAVYRKRYNYIESLIGNMYFVAFIMLFYALVIVPVENLVPGLGMIPLYTFLTIEFLYRGFAYYQFAGKTGAVAMAKAFGISLVIGLFWFGLNYYTIKNYIRYGF